MKIFTVNITKAQKKVFDYFRDTGIHNNVSAMVRQAISLQFYMFTGISTGVDDRKTLEVDVDVWFKHIPKEIAKPIWTGENDKGDYLGPVSISMSLVLWDFIDVIVETNKETSRSSFLRRALNEFFKKELITIETILRVKNGMKSIENKENKCQRKSLGKVDMRSVSWKPMKDKKLFENE